MKVRTKRISLGEVPRLTEERERDGFLLCQPVDAKAWKQGYWRCHILRGSRGTRLGGVVTSRCHQDSVVPPVPKSSISSVTCTISAIDTTRFWVLVASTPIANVRSFPLSPSSSSYY